MNLIRTDNRTLDFREAGLDDIPIIRKVAYETWQNTFEQMIPSAQLNYMLALIYSEDSLMRQILEFGHKFILVEKNHHVLGFASFEINFHAEQQLMIHNLYLLPAFQGISIGTKLLNMLSEIALENNNKQLRLKVFFKNVKAIGFYKNYGFKNIGIEKTDIGNNYEMLDNYMLKDL